MDAYSVNQIILYFMLYGAATSVAVVASCYMLLRRANAFVPEVTSPVLTRRWTAAFLAVMALTHVWWLVFYYLQPAEERFMGAVICTGLDLLTLLPTMVGTMYAMLQDRRRSLWPIAVPIALLVVFVACSIPFRSVLLPFELPLFLFTLVCVMLIMVRSVRQYGRWLRDNYADLEHKEVWQNFLILAAFLVCSVFYNLEITSLVLQYILQLIDIVLVVLLLWRVEKLQRLNLARRGFTVVPGTQVRHEAPGAEGDKPVADSAGIGELLHLHCVEGKFYLTNDVSLSQLADHIGCSRADLSSYLDGQGLSFNSYINGLRVDHFVGLYQEALAIQRPFTARHLAFNSGFSSYSHFGNAFKEAMGQTVTEWMHEQRK